VVEIDFNYEEGAKGEHTPVVRNYVVENLTCATGNRALDLQGLDNAPIYNVSMRNCTFGKVDKPSIVKNVKGLKLENVRVAGKPVDELA
jgi:hypothetical protein